MTASGKAGKIHVGIGGWTFEPWRGVFYPEKWPKAKELDYAGQHLTGIEINGTFYSSQKPASFVKWREAVPGDFVFTVKANRFCVNRRVLAEAGESIARFTGQGITELGPKLGPILWQLAATKKFDAEDMAAFLALMPKEQDGTPLRHAIEPRHESFDDPAFFAMCRKAGVAVVYAEAEKYPRFDEQTADFSYARIQCAREDLPNGYTDAELDRLADQARAWAAGENGAGRDVFLFFISGAKVRNPAAAQALIARLNG
ncbi:MAG: DUF72 domain-containing protein [Sphingomonadales bacterium]|nr:DUF72 domain-containing protein [Sphingomonadales bacterium]